jgi:NADPH:quinone reductase-like Zn-dependent oxidoreductase
VGSWQLFSLNSTTRNESLVTVYFDEMNRAIEANEIRAVVDEKVFILDQVKEAYQYMWDQKHFGKLCIKID